MYNYRKTVFLNKDQEEQFRTKKRNLKYPSDAEFLRAIMAEGLKNVKKYDPSFQL